VPSKHGKNPGFYSDYSRPKTRPPSHNWLFFAISFLSTIYFSSKSRYQVQRPSISEDQSRHSLSRASIEVKSKSNNPKKKKIDIEKIRTWYLTKSILWGLKSTKSELISIN
jgi:hypothetical protein